MEGFDWRYLAPEIELSLLAVVVIFLDLVLGGERKAWVGWLTALGTALVLALTAVQWNIPRVELWDGRFLVDPLSVSFKVIFLLGLFLTSLGSVHFASTAIRYTGEFYALMLFSTLGMMLMASAGDLIVLFLGLELSTLCLFALAALQKEQPASAEAGLKFLLIGLVSSAIFLYGASLLYGMLRTTRFDYMSIMVRQAGINQPALIVGSLLVTVGLAFKVTAAPFHMWAPDVYQGAPTPVTGFLSVASKSAGFSVVVRLFLGPLLDMSPQWTLLLAALSATSMIVGNLLAIPQPNIKRMLAYSGIAQAGYVLLALAAASEKGTASAIFYLFQYTFTNLGAFLVVIIMGQALGNDSIRSYQGLGRRNPLIAFCLLILLLSLGGIPPLSGFWGKLFLFWAGIESHLYWLVLIGVLATVVSLYYYLMVARAMYIDDPADASPVPVARTTAFALGLATLVVVLLGYPRPWMDMANQAVHSALFLGP